MINYGLAGALPEPRTRARVTSNCPRCGLLIVVQEWAVPGWVYSEFQDADGSCWNCSKAKRARDARRGRGRGII
jgi:hypothetical protein